MLQKEASNLQLIMQENWIFLERRALCYPYIFAWKLQVNHRFFFLIDFFFYLMPFEHFFSFLDNLYRPVTYQKHVAKPHFNVMKHRI